MSLRNCSTPEYFHYNYNNIEVVRYLLTQIARRRDIDTACLCHFGRQQGFAQHHVEVSRSLLTTDSAYCPNRGVHQFLRNQTNSNIVQNITLLSSHHAYLHVLFGEVVSQCVNGVVRIIGDACIWPRNGRQWADSSHVWCQCKGSIVQT